MTDLGIKEFDTSHLQETIPTFEGISSIQITSLSTILDKSPEPLSPVLLDHTDQANAIMRMHLMSFDESDKEHTQDMVLQSLHNFSASERHAFKNFYDGSEITLEDALCLSMRVLQTFMGEHGEQARKKFKDLPKFAYYLQRSNIPQTNCMIFNNGFINVFEIICKMYNSVLINKYVLVPLQATYRNDVTRSRPLHGQKQSLRHGYLNLMTLEKDRGVNTTLHITALDPYHANEKKFVPGDQSILQMDFSPRSTLDALLNLDTITGFSNNLHVYSYSRLSFLEAYLTQNISNYSLNDRILYLSLFMYYYRLCNDAALECERDIKNIYGKVEKLQIFLDMLYPILKSCDNRYDQVIHEVLNSMNPTKADLDTILFLMNLVDESIDYGYVLDELGIIKNKIKECSASNTFVQSSQTQESSDQYKWVKIRAKYDSLFMPAVMNSDDFKKWNEVKSEYFYLLSSIGINEWLEQFESLPQAYFSHLDNPQVHINHFFEFLHQLQQRFSENQFVSESLQACEAQYLILWSKEDNTNI